MLQDLNSSSSSFFHVVKGIKVSLAGLVLKKSTKNLNWAVNSKILQKKITNIVCICYSLNLLSFQIF